MNKRAFIISLTLGALLITQSSAAEEQRIPPRCPAMTPFLVVSGGGIKGAYQAGAIWYLVKHARCQFEHFAGTSTGAVTTALLSQADAGFPSMADLDERVDELVKNYKSLNDETGLAKKHFLG